MLSQILGIDPPLTNFEDLRKISVSRSLDPSFLREIRSLSRESNPELFFDGLFLLAQRLEIQKKGDLAANIFSVLAGGSPLVPNHLVSKAKQRLDGLMGKGPFVVQAEGILRNFSDAATDYRTIVPMMVGTMAGQLVKTTVAGRLTGVPRAWWTRGFASRSVSGLAGYAVEVPVFAGLAHGMAGDSQASFGSHLQSAAITLGAIKIFSWDRLPWQLRTASSPNRLISSLIPQTGIFLGLLSAHRLETHLGLRPQTDGTGLITGILSSMLSLGVGARLGHGILGPRFAQFQLEMAFRAGTGNGPSTGYPDGFFKNPYVPLPAMAGAVGQARKFPAAGPFLSKMTSLGDGSHSLPAASEIKQLRSRFRPLFPPPTREFFSDEIINKVFHIPSSHANFHEKLLQAFSQAENRGTLTQLYTASALERVFSANSLASSTGSFQYALIQKFVTESFGDSDSDRGISFLQKLFRAMEEGLSLRKLEELFTLAGYGLGPPNSPPQLPGLIALARESGHYHIQKIDAALAAAETSPFRNLILNRIFHILAVQDHPAKLNELSGEDDGLGTSAYILQLKQKGYSFEQIADQINGTRHTGYLSDLRLANKVLQVMLDVHPYIQDPEKRGANFEKLERAFFKFLQSGNNLDQWSLMNLFLTHSNAASDWLALAWRLGALKIEILPEGKFISEARNYQQPEGILAFIVPVDAKERVYRVVLQGLPKLDVSTQEGEWRAFFEVMIRLKTVAHEGEHWDHFLHWKDLVPRKNRHNRLLSEMLAYFEEYRWRIMNLEDDFGEKARRLGETPALHFRNLADQTYFKNVNEETIKKALKDH